MVYVELLVLNKFIWKIHHKIYYYLLEYHNSFKISIPAIQEAPN